LTAIEEDVRRLMQFYELRDEVEQAIVNFRNRLAAIQEDIAEAEKRFHSLVQPTQTLRVFHWQDSFIIVRWAEAGATVEYQARRPLI
jgi:hypothetical protein